MRSLSFPIAGLDDAGRKGRVKGRIAIVADGWDGVRCTRPCRFHDAASEAKSHDLTHRGRDTLKWQIVAHPLTIC